MTASVEAVEEVVEEVVEKVRPVELAADSWSRSRVKSMSSAGPYALGRVPSSRVLYSPNRLMCSARYTKARPDLDEAVA
ncbi:hypothetical protein [Streptomyces sp. NPDC004296]|uniref:hypothetical protein n=1 Tax=Streptomyces sp. NPDC004296 TaxID=3364697 RepID=UPI003694411B